MMSSEIHLQIGLIVGKHHFEKLKINSRANESKLKLHQRIQFRTDRAKHPFFAVRNISVFKVALSQS